MGNISSFKSFVGTHQNDAAGKSLVYIEEGDDVSTVPLPIVNAAITSTHTQLNEKHQPIRQVENFASVVISVNAPNPLARGSGQRRWFLSPVSSRRVGDVSFWKDVNENLIDSPEALGSVFHYLSMLDIAGFSARTKTSNIDIPADPDSYQAQLQLEEVEPFVHQFVAESMDASEPAATATALLSRYKTWLRKLHRDVPPALDGPLGPQHFGMNDLLFAVRRGTLRKLASGRYKRVKSITPPPSPAKLAALKAANAAAFKGQVSRRMLALAKRNAARLPAAAAEQEGSDVVVVVEEDVLKEELDDAVADAIEHEQFMAMLDGPMDVRDAPAGARAFTVGGLLEPSLFGPEPPTKKRRIVRQTASGEEEVEVDEAVEGRQMVGQGAGAGAKGDWAGRFMEG